MKKHLLLSLIVFGSYITKAQWVLIPDVNFRNYLNSYIPSCMNDTLMDTTCVLVRTITNLSLDYKAISNLEGIQYFDTLLNLSCNHNYLDSLPPLPATLKGLSCAGNNLRYLTQLPPGLTSLSCFDNVIDSVDAFPPTITYMDFTNNQLTRLPALPDSLWQTFLDYNQIDSLPALPGKLSRFFCDGNLITGLPPLPASLTYLEVSSNQLTTIPNLPAGLVQLVCRNNQITHLPEFPDSMNICWIDDNPLGCLPKLKRIVNLDFSNTNINCIPNYGNVTNSSPTLTSLPFCSLFNPNGCPIYQNVSGKVYFDNNANCLKDGLDKGLKNIPVRLWSNAVLVQQVLTDTNGVYSFDTDTLGTYDISVDTTYLPFRVNCPGNSSHSVVLTALDSLQYDNDFAVVCRQGFDVGVMSVSGRLSSGRNTQINIYAGNVAAFYQVGCLSAMSGTVTVTLGSGISYISPASGALTPANVSGNTITWNVADFRLLNGASAFNIIVYTPTSLPVGQQVCITVTVTSVAGDINLSNNTLTQCLVIRASFDPNDKNVYPVADVDEGGERWLTYTINFQNTGTDTAYDIYVDDTLDTDLDVSTFQLLAYSHQPLVQLKENAVRFNFPNIMLVDSPTNEPLSHGYVQYKIKVKSTAPVGTVINNTAYIYFDFNAPVVTNTTTNTLAIVSGIASSHEPRAVRIYPNPANGTFTIDIDENMIGSMATITDITGRKLLAIPLEARSSQLEAGAFPTGVYFVTVTGKDGGNATRKLVIQR